MANKKRQKDILDDLLGGTGSIFKETIPGYEQLSHWVYPVTSDGGPKNCRPKTPALVKIKQPNRAPLFAEIITANEEMQAILTQVKTVAKTKKQVLITGETGVGKELIVIALHRLSRLPGRLVAINVAGIDDNVFSDTLFGHCKGAFPGADRARSGLIEQAAGGTLFLDEIGGLSHTSQLRLLRLLENGEYMPLGQDGPKKTDARIVTATNHDLWDLQQAGIFRDDLNFRLRTHHIHIPPLRERMDDLQLLLGHFLEEATRTLNKKKTILPKGLIPILNSYSFPGNVRELQQMVFDAVSRQKGKNLSLAAFRSHIAKEKNKRCSWGVKASDIDSLKNIHGFRPRISKKRPQRKKKTTHYLSQETYDGLNDIKERIKKLLPAEFKSRISKSLVVDFSLRLILAEFETREKESLLLQQILAPGKNG